MILGTFLVALAVALVLRGPGVFLALVVLFAVFAPLERLLALRRQRVLRRGLLTDLTHLLVNTPLVSLLMVPAVVLAALPLLWLRPLDLEGLLPAAVSVPLAVVVVLVGQYWGHRLAHEVPFLWRFHRVHHSIEQMDWVASARLHPLDQVFTQTIAVVPLVLLGYSAVSLVAVNVGLVLLALFQHANVRVRFPGLRWVINTPEWHHWHHAVDVRNKNFGLPLVDLCFGTAYLPHDRRAARFGLDGPAPPESYLRHLAAPFTEERLARA
ncbi:MAG: hypothetical protein AMXMBFR46_09730 [Acidimicrobiia bacterium]